MNILSRVGFFFYWIFDNLQILAKIKFLDVVDKDVAAKRAAKFWLLALVFGVILVLVQIYETQMEEKFLIENLKKVGADEQKVESTKDKLHGLQKKKVENILNLLKNLGDMVTAT